MRLRRRISSLPEEGGFAIVEVLVSGVIAVIAAAGVMALMQTSVHSAAEQRIRSQSYALAQEDQARLRASRIPTLRNFTETRPVTVGKTTYSVKSTGKFVNDTSETLSCGSDSSTEDYVKISSEVTWTNMANVQPTVIRSIISPPSNSLNPKTGTLVFNARTAANVPIFGLALSGTGAGTFTGSTNAAGCAVFLEQATGLYALKISGGSGTTGMVDVDGVGLPNENKPLTVNPQTTTSIDLLYDKPGSVKLKFLTSTYTTGTEPASATNVIAYNSGMTTAKKYTFASATSYTATSLFPFTSADSFYVGTCTENAPSSGTTPATVVIPVNAAAAEQSITMPALLLNVKKNNTPTNSIAVKITSEDCGGTTRETTTSTQPTSGGTAGRILNQELPWGTYTVCAWTTMSGTDYRRVSETFDVKTLKTEKSYNITTSSEAGKC